MIAVPESHVDAEDVDAHLHFMFLQGLADQMAEPVLIGVPSATGDSGTVVYANEAATERLGCGFENLMGRSVPKAVSNGHGASNRTASAGAVDRFRASRFGARVARSPLEVVGGWSLALFRDAKGLARYMFYVLAEPA